MEIRNLSDVEFETLFRRMLKEPCKDLSSIKRCSQKLRIH